MDAADLGRATGNAAAAAVGDRFRSLIEPDVLRGLASDLGFRAVVDSIMDAVGVEVDSALVQLAGETDLGRLRHTAHTLKSTSRMLGADALADFCQQLETAAGESSSNVAALAALVGRLARDLVEDLPEIRRTLVEAVNGT